MAGFVDHPPSPCPQSRRASPQVPGRLRRHPPRGPYSASAGGGDRGLLDPSFCAPALPPPLPRAPRPKRSLETRAPRAPGRPGPRRALAAVLTRDLWAGAQPPPPRPTSPSRARLPCASPHAVRPRLFETPAGSRTARSSRSAARWLCHAARAVALSPPSPPSPLICQCPPRRRAASEPREGTRASFLLDGGVCTPGGVRVGSCERLSLSSVLRWEDTRVSGSASHGARHPGREPVGAAARSAGPRGWGLSPWRARALRRHEAQRRPRTRVRTPLNRLPTSRPRPEARPEGQAGERPWPQAPVSERPRPAQLCSPPAGASSQPRSLDLLYRELK